MRVLYRDAPFSQNSLVCNVFHARIFAQVTRLWRTTAACPKGKCRSNEQVQEERKTLRTLQLDLLWKLSRISTRRMPLPGDVCCPNHSFAVLNADHGGEMLGVLTVNVTDIKKVPVLYSSKVTMYRRHIHVFGFGHHFRRACKLLDAEPSAKGISFRRLELSQQLSLHPMYSTRSSAITKRRNKLSPRRSWQAARSWH